MEIFELEQKLTPEQKRHATDAVNFYLCEEYSLCRKFLDGQISLVRIYALEVLAQHSPALRVEFAKFIVGGGK